MAEIKKLQKEKDNGDWEKLSEEAKQEVCLKGNGVKRDMYMCMHACMCMYVCM